MTAPLVSLTRADGIARLTLERPDKLNALTVPMRDALLEALETVAADADTRCLVLAGRGRAFCTGQDLAERAPILDGVDIDLGRALDEGLNRVILALTALPQPVVGAVQGAAVGAGASLALACDILIAAEDATFHVSFARLGLSGDCGATCLLPQKIGHARAARLLLRGDAFTAAEACDWGLVGTVVPLAELDAAAMADATRIASLSPLATRAIKALLAQASTGSLAGQLQREAAWQTQTGRSAAYRDSLSRFLKRTP